MISDNKADILNLDVTASIATAWLQKKYFSNNFGFIEPVQVELGDRFVIYTATQTVDSVKSYGYYIPFISNLKQLLGMPEVATSISSRVVLQDGISRDYMDGDYVKNHEIYRTGTIHDTFRIVAYTDDIEVVNPIGVHVKKNKLSLFFWTLVSVPPNLRSRTCAIQLLAVAKVSDIRKFGVSKLLLDFISGLKQLYAKQEVQSNPRCWLVAFSGDTLATNFAAGFKEGVGFANKMCRTCEATQMTSPLLFRHEDCTIRDDEEHRARCRQLALPLTPAARQYWSAQYGINESSFLLEVPGFYIISCMLHDPMHILFEGVTMYETKLFLKYAIFEAKYFTLMQFNR